MGEGEWLGVHAAAAVEEAARPAPGEAAAPGSAAGLPPPGELAVRDGRLLFGCAGGALELRIVQAPGGRPMEAAAYVRGHPLARA